MEAVASVILNRAANPRWWGQDLRGVLLAPLQFSCWNPNDPQYERIRTVTAADAKFRECQDVTARAMASQIVDRTGGADHYYNPAAANPSWARGRTPSAVIGNHRFLRLELPPPPTSPATLPQPQIGDVQFMVQDTFEPIPFPQQPEAT